MENGLSVLHSLLKDTNVNTPCFKNGISFVEESQLLNFAENATVQEIVSLINSALHNPLGDRHRALQVLGKCAKQCSDDVFTSNAILWMQHCSQWSPQSINVELKILNRLIIRSVGNPDLKKQINAVTIPRIVERLNNCSSTAKSTVVLKLICLKSLLEGYTSSCSPFRTQLYKYLMFTLKNYCEYDEIISPAARCLVYLHSCGPAGQQGVNYKERWTSQFNACISTYHKLLDLFYAEVKHMKNNSEKSNETIFDDFLELKQDYLANPTMRYFGLRRCCNVLSAMMQAMLLCKFPVGKSFNIRDTMNLICRILSVTQITLQDESVTNDVIAIGTNLPFLHLCGFELLRSLIICAKRNLILHSTLICKLCIQSLKWISTVARINETTNPFLELQRKAYHTLSTWLSVAGTCSSIEVFADELVPLLISSIECKKRSVSILLDQTKKKGKRKRSQISSEISLNAEAASSSGEATDEAVCSLAHNTLQLMLRNASIFIKWEHHKTLHTIIVNQLLDIQKCSVERDYPSMYSNSRCRLMLYGSLLTALTEPHPKWFAPMSYAVNIFDAGINDAQTEISTFCKFAVTQIEAINHPKAPSLHCVNEPPRSDKPADMKHLIMAAASISTPATISSSTVNAKTAEERLVPGFDTSGKSDTIPNSTVQPIPPESKQDLGEKSTNNIDNDDISIVSTLIQDTSTNCSMETSRSDSPPPKKFKKDDIVEKSPKVQSPQVQGGALESDVKSKSVDQSCEMESVEGSNAEKVSSEGDSMEVDKSTKGKGSLWPDEDDEVDLMLQDFVGEID